MDGSLKEQMGVTINMTVVNNNNNTSVYNSGTINGGINTTVNGNIASLQPDFIKEIEELKQKLNLVDMDQEEIETAKDDLDLLGTEIQNPEPTQRKIKNIFKRLVDFGKMIPEADQFAGEFGTAILGLKEKIGTFFDMIL